VETPEIDDSSIGTAGEHVEVVLLYKIQTYDLRGRFCSKKKVEEEVCCYLII
jgi:hypothetical protein